MIDFLDFRRMITPFLIMMVFFLGTITLVAGGCIYIGRSIHQHDRSGIVYGILVVLIGPLLLRIWCEMVVVLFKIHQALEDRRHDTA